MRETGFFTLTEARSKNGLRSGYGTLTTANANNDYRQLATDSDHATGIKEVKG
jgi:hypothetical protein